MLAGQFLKTLKEIWGIRFVRLNKADRKIFTLMKIRIKGNSIRLRLAKSETEIFANKGFLQDSTSFGNNSLVYAMKSYRGQDLSAELDGATITVYVPEHFIKDWIGSNLVGLEYAMALSSGESLHILIEKDFKCIDALITEDQTDYFENPAKSC